MRSKIIFGLTHGYPLFIVAHLWLGDNSRFSRVLLAVIPLIIFTSLLICWVSTANIKLSKTERFNLKCLIWNLIFISCYYGLCIYSLPAWAYNRNYQAGAFIAITSIFYCLNHEFGPIILRRHYD